MIFYAIRQKSTGFFLLNGGKGKGGHTKQEPSNVRPPRLFLLSQTAKRALNCYVQGKWRESYSIDHNGESDYSGPEPDWKTKRDKEDFEVVELILTPQ